MGRYGDPAHYVPVKNKRGGDFRRGYPLSWELRLEIIKLHLQGISHRQIANRTKRARATVGRICTKYDLTFRPEPGAQRPMSTPPLLKVPELFVPQGKTHIGTRQPPLSAGVIGWRRLKGGKFTGLNSPFTIE